MVESSKPLKTNVRVVAATNENMQKAIASGKFREDLYYRLNVGMVQLPPLRDRRDDIPLLVMHFVREFDRAEGKEATRVSDAVMKRRCTSETRPFGSITKRSTASEPFRASTAAPPVRSTTSMRRSRKPRNASIAVGTSLVCVFFSSTAGAIGYALGVFAVWLVRFMLSRPSSPPATRTAWAVLVVAAAIGLVFSIYFFHVWQDQVRDLMGVPRLKWFNYPQAAIIGVVVLFAFVEIGQLIGRLIRFLVRQLNRVAPPRVSFVVVVAVVLGLSIALLNGVVIKGTMSFLNKSFAAVNDEMDPNNPAPTTPLRSGGPGSLVSWNTLGNQGRIFVAGGPKVEQLTKFNGAPEIGRAHV